MYTKEEKQSADGQTAVLRVYRFTGSPDSPKTVWQIEDGPADLKIVLYEGEKRYAMNGKLSTASASGALQGDEGVMDQSFKDGPSAFRSLASKLWQGWRAGIAR